MEETGIVERSRENGYALVRAGNRELCERSKCGASYHAFGEESERGITAVNQGGAKVGD